MDLEKVGKIVQRRKENAMAKSVGATTADARENMSYMKDDAVWDKGANGFKDEVRLRHMLLKIFSRDGEKINYSEKHRDIKTAIEGKGFGDLRGMQYRAFVDWMKGERVSKSRISAKAMKGMKYYAESMVEK